MKTIAIVLLLVASCSIGCRGVSSEHQSAEAKASAVSEAPLSSTPPIQHLTAEQAIALAKPSLWLPPGDQYRARFIPEPSTVYAPGSGPVRQRGNMVGFY